MPTHHGDVLNWASDLDPNALAQAERTAALPFVVGHVALMPDAHVGMGATIGSVIPTDGAIIPSAVGVDIGCGMIAAELAHSSDLLGDDLRALHEGIARVVPAGVGKGHGRAVNSPRERRYHRFTVDRPGVPMDRRQADAAFRQFGSLGSGNHFVEVCLDERDRVWVVLHSGSRGVGNQLAQQHITVAKGLMKAFFVELDDPDLAYLVEGTAEFDAYVQHMLWAQDYALANREVMMDAVLAQVAESIGAPVEVTRRVNCHHNFTAREHHLGRNLWITRKGAIRARTGDLGVIPGSMGTRSYIVEGLGSAASYTSCSHGAGRRMSRGRARRELDLEGLRAQMAGRAWNDAQAAALLDEDPRSYKDIDRVMADQVDLVTVQHTLSQVLNYKGT